MLLTAAPVAELYYSDYGTYQGMTMTKLRALAPKMSTVEVAWATKNRYCLQVNLLGSWGHAVGPVFAFGATRCPGSSAPVQSP